MNHYQGYFLERDELQDKAYKLWLYYHVQTEEFDKKLSYTYPSPDEDGTVVPYSGYSMSQSYKNARDTRELVYNIAMYHCISDEVMLNEERQARKCKYLTMKREFDYLYELGDIQFIFDCINEQTRNERKLIVINPIF